MRIGLFDSGIGGLTVLKKLMSKYPNNEYIYFGDTKNVPYGIKSVNELESLTSKIIEFLIEKKVDVIVIACGTVSSNLADILRKKYDLPIIDIISPTINYINNNDYNRIGVIATNATINSKVFSKQINKDVKEVACKEFASLIEKNDMENLNKYIEYYLKDLKDRELIVLGCTHYPLIKDKINKYLESRVELLDMSDCIPNIFTNNSQKSIEFYFTKIDDILLNNIRNILDIDTNNVHLIQK